MPLKALAFVLIDESAVPRNVEAITHRTTLIEWHAYRREHLRWHHWRVGRKMGPPLDVCLEEDGKLAAIDFLIYCFYHIPKFDSRRALRRISGKIPVFEQNATMLDTRFDNDASPLLLEWHGDELVIRIDSSEIGSPTDWFEIPGGLTLGFDYQGYLTEIAFTGMTPDECRSVDQAAQDSS